MKKFIKILIMLFSILQTAHAKEIKLGLMQHDFDTKFGHRHEKGQNIIIDGGMSSIIMSETLSI